MPMCGVMGDAELFDYFLDFQLVAQALAGIHGALTRTRRITRRWSCPRLKAALGDAVSDRA